MLFIFLCFFCLIFRLPQTRLAEQVTLLVHGKEGLQKAQQSTEVLYKKSIHAIKTMTADEMKVLFEGADVVELLPAAGETILDLAMKVGCFPTKRKIIFNEFF